MLGMASVLLLTLVTAALILVALPESLETLATPAFGAPWMTSLPAGLTGETGAAATPCAK